MLHRSKTRVTEEEAKEIVELFHSFQKTPVIAFGSAHARTGGASADARRRFIRRIDGLAVKYGLEPQEGEWGFDSETRQFLSSFPIVEHLSEED